MEKMTRTDVNNIKEDWDLFFAFSMAAAHMDPNNKKRSVLDMEVEPVGSRNEKNSIARKRTYAETVANYVTPRVAPQIATATHV